MPVNSDDDIDEVAYAFQTDSIEKWIIDPDYFDMTVNVTSTHSKTLGRHVPVMMSVTFYQTGNDYKEHFNQLLTSCQYSDFEEFDQLFPGNICDFSGGEQLGFEMSVSEFFNFSFTEQKLQLESYCRFCVVHFDRIVTRVKSSHTLTPRSAFRIFWT